MTKRKKRVPTYRLHKASGQAIVTLKGRTYYLGKFGTPESRIAYNRLLADWEADDRSTSSVTVSPAPAFLAALVDGDT